MVARVAGVLLVLLGLFGILQGEFSFTTDQETVELGPMEVTATERETVDVPEVLGVVALVGGIVLLIVGFRQKPAE